MPKKVKVPKPQTLSRKQRRKLEKILERKKKLKDRKTLIEDLKKYQISNEELKSLSSVSNAQTKGVKRLFAEKAGNCKKSRRNKRQKSENIDEAESDDNSTSESDAESQAAEDDHREDRVVPPETSTQASLNSAPTACPIEIRKPKPKPKPTASTSSVKTSTEGIKKQEPEITEKTQYIPIMRTPEMQKLRSMLPVVAEEQNIMETIRYNPVTIICGETGSGKTTQLPQFLYEAGYAATKRIAITEPRRVAAISVSKRVATEMNVSTDIVSYQIRFAGNVTKDSKIVFVTDGVLLREIQNDFLLTSYSVVIIDEAHERSLYSDILIGLLSRIVPLRYKKGIPLRLIIMSATLRVEDFAKNTSLFKEEPKIINVDSRQFPVSVHFSKRTPEDYLKEAYAKVCKIHRSSPDGGILVFVTGQQEVNVLCKKLRRSFPCKMLDKSGSGSGSAKIGESKKPDVKKCAKKAKTSSPTVLKDLMPKINLDNYTELEEANDASDDEEDDDDDESALDVEEDSVAQPLYCLPLYSMLPESKQSLIFEPPPEGSRLCVVATNVAETSLTIPDVKYVVDTGKVKIKVYDKVTGISALHVTWTSKASADQRSGRAGRICAGHCYRLYSSTVFTEHFPQFSEPEIAAKPIDDLILQMKSMNIENIGNFPFPTRPDLDAVKAGERRLVALGALTEDKTAKSPATKITPLGKVMSYFPVHPRYAKMLALSVEQGLLSYVVAIISAMTVQHVFLQDSLPEGNSKSNRHMQMRRKWIGVGEAHKLGDIMLLLKAVGAADYCDCSVKFCEAYGLRYKAMTEISKLRKQLSTKISKIIQNNSISFDSKLEPPSDNEVKFLRQLVLTGFFDHIAKKCTDEECKELGLEHKTKGAYRSIETEKVVFIHSSSVLADLQPEFVVYQEVYETNKLYMRNLVAIEPEWIAVYAPNLCQFSKPLEQPSPRYDPLLDQVMCYVSGTFGPYSWPLPKTEVEFPTSVEKYRWFARFFLDGEVIPALKQFKAHLLSSPTIMTKSWAKLQPRTEILLSSLMANKCDSQQSLVAHWKKDRLYLCSEYSLWVDSTMHEQVRQKWTSFVEDFVSGTNS